MEILVAFALLALSPPLSAEPIHPANSSAIGRFGRTLKAIDWCSLSCTRERENIACTLKGECQNIASPCKWQKLDVKRVLAEHNKLRNKLALGKDARAPNLKIANMMVLNWDEDLAFLAQCNLVACPTAMEHDDCRRTPKYIGGQNIAWSSGRDDCLEYAYSAIANGWYAEIKFLTLDEMKAMSQTFESKPSAGHFTQVVWATSAFIGCALYKRTEGDKVDCMFTCDYGPAGNMLGGSMFKLGEPASQCPDGVKRNSKYAGLCGVLVGRGTPKSQATSGVVLVSLLLLQIVCVFLGNKP